MDSALEEWIVYTHEDIPENWYLKEQATDKTIYHRVDHYWRNVFQLRNTSGQPKFTKHHKFIPCLVTISHGNADVERSLSHNKNVLTSEQSSVSLEVLIGLWLTKDNVKHMKANLPNIPVTQQMQVCSCIWQMHSNNRDNNGKGKEIRQE